MKTNIERIEGLEATVQSLIEKNKENEDKRGVWYKSYFEPSEGENNPLTCKIKKQKEPVEGDKISGMSVYDYYTKLGREDNKECLDYTNRIEKAFEKAYEKKHRENIRYQRELGRYNTVLLEKKKESEKIDTLIDEKCKEIDKIVKEGKTLIIQAVELRKLKDRKSELNS